MTAVTVRECPQLVDEDLLGMTGDLTGDEKAHPRERPRVRDGEMRCRSSRRLLDIRIVENDEGRLRGELESILVEIPGSHHGVVA